MLGDVLKCVNIFNKFKFLFTISFHDSYYYVMSYFTNNSNFIYDN